MKDHQPTSTTDPTSTPPTTTSGVRMPVEEMRDWDPRKERFRGEYCIIDYDPDDPKMLAHWFDPHGIDHMRAYEECFRCTYDAQRWPDWFADRMDREGVVQHTYWQTMLNTKIVNAWIQHILAGTTTPP